MSDWSMYEVENIGWDALQEIDDHIVPHPGGKQANENVAQGDFHKEQHHGVAVSVGGSTDSNTSIDKHVLQVKEKAMVHSSLQDGKVPMLERRSCSHIHDDAFPASYNSVSVSSGNGFPFEDNKIPDSCFKRRNVASVGSGFSAEDCILGSRDAVADRNFCFQLDDLSPAGSDLKFYGNEHGEKDILDCGLPDIGNFEDIDRMFRNSDSTFGQENTGAMDGNKLSFFPTSSNSLEDNDDAFRSGTRSPCSESSALKITTKNHKANMNFMPGTDAPLILDFFDEKSSSCVCKSSSWRPDDDEPSHVGYCNHANHSDVNSDNKTESAHGKKPDEGNSMDEVKASPLYQAKKVTGGTRFQHGSVEILQKKQGKSQNQAQNNTKDQFSEYPSDTSLHPVQMQQSAYLELPSSLSSAAKSCLHADSYEKHLWQSDASCYLPTCTPYMHADYSYPSCEHSVAPTMLDSESESEMSYSYEVLAHSSSHSQAVERAPKPLSNTLTMSLEQKIENLHQQQKLQAPMIIEQLVYQTPFNDHSLFQKKSHRIQDVRSDNGTEEVRLELPSAKIDSSTVQESSCLNFVLSDGLSLEAMSFWQLLDVTEQLDVKTKLCIRDSLYRLARSAEERHNSSGTSSDSKDSRAQGATPSAEETNMSVGLMDVETKTNHIDRSMVHLLFYGPVEPWKKASNGTLSLESHIIVNFHTRYAV